MRRDVVRDIYIEHLHGAPISSIDRLSTLRTIRLFDTLSPINLNSTEWWYSWLPDVIHSVQQALVLQSVQRGLTEQRISSNRSAHAIPFLCGERELSLLSSLAMHKSIIISRWLLCRCMCSLMSSRGVMNWYRSQQCPLRCVRVHLLAISSIMWSVIIILYTAMGSVNWIGGWARAESGGDQRPRFDHKTKLTTASCPIFWS